MKKFLLTRISLFLTCLFLFTLIAPTITAIADEQSGDEEALVDIIVRYEDTVPESDTLDPSYQNVRTLDLLPIQTMTVPASAVKTISQQDGVRRVSYDQEMTTSETATRALTENDWNNDMVGAFDAWDEGITGEGYNVAVIDTGFSQHPDINYAGGYSVFGEEDDWTNDGDGHGTHVAGIIGAFDESPVRGVAPGANLFGVKVYATDTPNTTSSSNLLLGIQWAIENNMNIINISSGFEQTNLDIHEAIIAAANAGILVVAASGNSTGGYTEIDYPAAYPEVIAVSNIDQDQNLASDSKISAQNELAAPGQSVVGLSSTGGYILRSGTSQATPHVVGIAALLMQKYGTTQVRGLLQENAFDLGPAGRDDHYGYGLVRYAPLVLEAPETEEETEETQEEETQEEETEEAVLEEEIVEESPTETPEEATIEEVPESEVPEIEESEIPTETQPDIDTPVEEQTEESSEEALEDSAEEPIEDPTEEPIEDSTEEQTEEATTEPEEALTDDSVEEQAAETSDEEEAPEVTDEQSVDVSKNSVWIRPEEREGSALLTEEDFAAVADNGVIAVSFDASMTSIDQLLLTSAQVQQLKERNISILIAKLDMEWLIPSVNFQEGETLLRFSNDIQQEVPKQDQAEKPLYTFEMSVNGTSIQAFEADMRYRLFEDSVAGSQHSMYHWSHDQDGWSALESTYSNGAVVSNLNQTGTLGLFNPSAFEDPEEEAEAAEEEEDTEEIIDEDSAEDDALETEETESNQAGTSDSSNIPAPAIIVSVVALASFGGGFYYFGGKPK